MLGLAQLTKFTMLLLYAVWPFLWLVWLVLVDSNTREAVASIPRAFAHWTGDRRSERRDHRHGISLRGSGHSARPIRVWIEDLEWPWSPGRNDRAARTRCSKPPGNSVSTVCAEPGSGAYPVPSRALCTGFRRAKDRDRGNTNAHFQAIMKRGPECMRADDRQGRSETGNHRPRRKGVDPVDLNGELRRTGWWYYYLLTLVYKVPEGTWAPGRVLALPRSGSLLARLPTGRRKSRSGLLPRA